MNKLYYLLCPLLFLFVGCDSNEELEPDPVTPEITIPSVYSSIELDSDQLNQTVTFTATADWSITLDETTKSTPTWLSVSPTSGSAGSVTLTLTLDENKSEEERSAEIIISSDEVENSISVTQKAFGPTLSLGINSEEVSSMAGSISLALSSNVEWVVSDLPEWITIDPASGDSGKTIIISYEVNETTEVRSATIIFYCEEYNLEEEFTLSQDAFEPILSLSSSSESVGVDAGSFEIELTSNLEWTVSDLPEWITLNPASGDSGKTITISYEANASTEVRSATIIFYCEEYDVEAELIITQAALQLGDLTDGGKL